jgi:ankyrin repeat protein
LGADITLRDAYGKNILHYVVAYAPHLFQMLLTRLKVVSRDISGFILDQTSELGLTPFDLAVQSENFDCANALLALGAQYDNFIRPGETGENYTTLRYAAGSLSQMSYLLELEKPPSLVICDNGFTIFHLVAAAFDVGKHTL